MSWVIEVTYHGEEESTDLYGPFLKPGKAKWDAEWLQRQIDALPQELGRRVSVSARPLSRVRTGQEMQAIINEARTFLEPDDEPETEEHSYAMYSIDHSGSGS